MPSEDQISVVWTQNAENVFISICIAVLALFFLIGVFQYDFGISDLMSDLKGWLTERKQQKEEYQNQLKQPLLPAEEEEPQPISV